MNSYVNSINLLTQSTNLVEANLKFALKIAHTYKNKGLPLEDLVQEANLGLIKAAEKFDPNKGVKFISFAVHYIRKYIKAALGCNRNIVSEPGSFQHKAWMIQKATNEIQDQFQRDATVSEIAALTGYSKKVVISSLKTKINSVISLDKPISNESDKSIENIFLVDNIETNTPSDQLEYKEKYEMLNKALMSLEEREREALTLRYIENYTLNEVGIEIDMTPAGASNLIKRALKKMKAKGEM